MLSEQYNIDHSFTPKHKIATKNEAKIVSLLTKRVQVMLNLISIEQWNEESFNNSNNKRWMYREVKW